MSSPLPAPPPPASDGGRHTFVNHIVAMLEELDRHNSNEEVTKDEMAREVRTSLLRCMRAGLVHPFTTFYSLEASTVVEGGASQAPLGL